METKEMNITHTVIKNDDVLAMHKGHIWMQRLELICDAVNVSRLPKPPNQYIVINTDEPYIDEIIAVLKKHGDWGDKK